MKIIHLTHNEINLQKWDAYIQSAHNSLVYAESWYLDVVSPYWEALVLGDYEFVMPLPVKQKFGISFLVQPPLTQQLGIFSSHKIDENIVENFINKIPYKSFHLDFNEQNPFHNGKKQSNHILNLNKNYRSVFADYSTNTKRNLKKADNFNIKIKTNLSVNDFLEFYHATEKNYSVPPDTKVNSLILESLRKNKITLYGAYNKENLLVSALCLLHSSQRLIYLLPVSNQEGKEIFAMFKIVDKIIKQYANSNYLLDFAGSNIKNIARFYESFGAKLNYYYEVKHWSINDLIKRFRFWI